MERMARSAVPSRTPSMLISPVGRAVRRRQNWTEEEVEVLKELLFEYPGEKARFYARKFTDLGYEKTADAVHNKLKNMDQTCRKLAREIRL
jgi:hypothetical protein